jgi:hypothetical protein
VTIILGSILVSASLLMAACVWLFRIFPEAYTGSPFAWPLAAFGVLTVLASLFGLAAKSRRDSCYWGAVLLAVLTPLVALISVPAWGSTGDGGIIGIIVVGLASVPVTTSGIAGCIYSASARRRPKTDED